MTNLQEWAKSLSESERKEIIKLKNRLERVKK